MSPRLLRFCIFGAPVLIWIIDLFVSGTASARYETSWKLIQDTLRWLCPEHAPPGDGSAIQVTVSMYQINGALRRLAHVVAYAILALLTVRAMQAGNPRLKMRSLGVASGIGLLFTALDELHRHFETVRHAKWEDVELDLTGVALTLLVTIFYFWVKNMERRLAEDATRAAKTVSEGSESRASRP